MTEPTFETKSKESNPVKKEKSKKTIHQILTKLQSQGVNASLSKKRSKLVLGSY